MMALTTAFASSVCLLWYLISKTFSVELSCPAVRLTESPSRMSSIGSSDRLSVGSSASFPCSIALLTINGLSITATCSPRPSVRIACDNDSRTGTWALRVTKI